MKKISLLLSTLATVSLVGATVQAQTQFSKTKLIQKQSSSVKSTTPITAPTKSIAPILPSQADSLKATGTANRLSARDLIAKTILELCQRPNGCEFVLPTQADLAELKKDSELASLVQDFSEAIRKGNLPVEAGYLAAVDPKSPALAALNPELANRLNQVSDRRASLHNLQNFTAGMRQVATIGVGPDGRPTYTVSNRESQSGDGIRAGISFISEGGDAAPREVDGSDASSNQGNESPLDPSQVASADREIFGANTASEDGSRESRSVNAQSSVDAFFNALGSTIFGFIIGREDQHELSTAILTDPSAYEVPAVSPLTPLTPSIQTQSPDAVDQSGPRISTQGIVNAHRRPNIDPGDLQSVNLTNNFPSGSFVDPDPDRMQSGIGALQIPVTQKSNTATGGNVTTPNDQGSGNIQSGSLQDVNASFQADRCDAKGGCVPAN